MILILRGFDDVLGLGTSSQKMTTGFDDVLGTSSAKISKNNVRISNSTSLPK